MSDSSATPMPSAARLQGDRPIKSEAEDLLGFSSFADALSRSLTEMAPDEGLVISVEGEWGSGKTSAIELTTRRIVLRELARETSVKIEELERKDWASIEEDWSKIISSRRTHLIRFNPWNFSGQENLVRAFFSEVGATIGHPPEGKVGKAVKKIIDYLPSVGTVTGTGLAAVAGHGIGAGAGGSIGKALGESARRLLTPVTTLEGAKRELDDALRESGKRIIVIIDDLDRLLPSEMRAMFSLAKSLGDLPNIFYVLSFDRQVVTKALQQGPEPVGADFLEKIIQVQLKLPPPWEPEIRQLFAARVNAVLGEAVIRDQSRWQSAFRQAIAPYFKTPRDVARVSDALQVIWPNVVGDVDITDLILVTTLQHFEPSIYQMMFENISELGGESVTFEDDKVFSARFVPKNARDQRAATKALAHLFPRLAKGWNEHVWDGAAYLVKREHRRLCTREYYRNYFLFGRDPDRSSRADVEGMLTCQDPGIRLRKMIENLSTRKSRQGASRVAALLDQILEIVFSKPLLSDAMATAILDCSDDLTIRKDIVWELFITDNLERLDSILVFGLTPLAPGVREDLVKLISTHPRGLSLCARVISHLARQHGLHGGDARHESEQLVSKTSVEQAENALLKRIREAAAKGMLLATAAPIFLLWIWKDLAGADEVANWIADIIESDENVLRLAELLPSTSYQSGGDGQKEIRSVKAETYKDFLDMGAFELRLEEVAASNAFPAAQKVRSDFLDALEAGKVSRF